MVLKKYQVPGTVPSGNPPKVNRTVPYRAVPCSGKAPLEQDLLNREQLAAEHNSKTAQMGAEISAGDLPTMCKIKNTDATSYCIERETPTNAY